MPDATDRRGFLATTALAVAGCATGSRGEGADTVIDTHTHFYDPTRPGGVLWPPSDDSFLCRRVLPAEFKRLAEPLGIVGTVVVEASPRIEDNDWLLDLAEREPFLLGIVGHLKPGRPGFAADLPRFAAWKRFRGFRVGGWDTQVTPRVGDWLRDVQAAAERDLALDVLIGPDDLQLIVDLADRLPSLRIVVDHCANLRIDGQAPPRAWREGVAKLAARSNVFMKVSGLVEGAAVGGRTPPADAGFYKPVLDVVWESFGPERVLYASNWPVSGRFASLATTLAIVREYFGAKGGEVLARCLSSNARNAYKLNSR